MFSALEETVVYTTYIVSICFFLNVSQVLIENWHVYDITVSLLQLIQNHRHFVRHLCLDDKKFLTPSE
jgi:hypothetical protein